MGGHSCTSGHPEKLWEAQDGHEVANDKIFVDLGMISGPIYFGFSGPKCFENRVIFKHVSMSYF